MVQIANESPLIMHTSPGSPYLQYWLKISPCIPSSFLDLKCKPIRYF